MAKKHEHKFDAKFKSYSSGTGAAAANDDDGE